MRRQSLASMVLVSLVAAPALAVPKTRLAVIDLGSPSTMTGMATQVTTVILKEAKAQGYRVASPSDVRAKLGEKAYGELQTCGGKPACVVARLATLEVDRAIVGQLDRDERAYLVKLWLIDLSSVSVIADVDRSILIASRRLQQDVAAAIPGLLRGEREARGTLEVVANIRDARVTIDGEFRGATPLTLELKPGKHEVRVEKRKYLTSDQLAVVEPGKASRLEVRMLLRPGEKPDEELPQLALTKPDDQARTGLVVPPAGWVAGGVALAAAAGGAVLGLGVRNLERDLQAGYDPATGTYQGTRQQALEARRNATLANICFGVAGAALATGVVVTLVDDGADGSSVSAAPAGTGVVVSGRW